MLKPVTPSQESKLNQLTSLPSVTAPYEAKIKGAQTPVPVLKRQYISVVRVFSAARSCCFKLIA